MTTSTNEKSLASGGRGPFTMAIGVVLTLTGILNVFRQIAVELINVPTMILFAAMMAFIGTVFFGFGLQWIIQDGVQSAGGK
ncbi:MAG: hypothetical protein RTU30_06860, partial [Candidatus Thorarchaeota archaeon]